MDLTFVLILLVLFQIKHMFADFYLQTPVMLVDRDQLVHPGRALHCLVHSVGTILCLLIMSVPLLPLLIVAAAEWIVHYLIDFGKGVWSERAGHTPADPSYWRAFGVDQTLHQLTYVVMVLALA